MSTNKRNDPTTLEFAPIRRRKILRPQTHLRPGIFSESDVLRKRFALKKAKRTWLRNIHIRSAFGFRLERFPKRLVQVMRGEGALGRSDRLRVERIVAISMLGVAICLVAMKWLALPPRYEA